MRTRLVSMFLVSIDAPLTAPLLFIQNVALDISFLW